MCVVWNRVPCLWLRIAVLEIKEKHGATKLCHYPTLFHLLKKFWNFHLMNQYLIYVLKFLKAWEIENLTFTYESEVLDYSVHVIEVWRLSFLKIHYLCLLNQRLQCLNVIKKLLLLSIQRWKLLPWSSCDRSCHVISSPSSQYWIDSHNWMLNQA